MDVRRDSIKSSATETAVVVLQGVTGLQDNVWVTAQWASMETFVTCLAVKIVKMDVINTQADVRKAVLRVNLEIFVMKRVMLVVNPVLIRKLKTVSINLYLKNHFT